MYDFGVEALHSEELRRSYRAGDGVRDFERIRWAKGLTLYDPRLIELQKEYARQVRQRLREHELLRDAFNLELEDWLQSGSYDKITAELDAAAPSHILGLRAGMIRQLGAGAYTYLPLGHRVLRKAAQIVREEITNVLDGQAKRVKGISSWERYLEVLLEAARKN